MQIAMQEQETGTRIRSNDKIMISHPEYIDIRSCFVSNIVIEREMFNMIVSYMIWLCV